MTDFNNSDNPSEPDQIDMMDGNELKENLRQEIDKNFRERQKMLDELAEDIHEEMGTRVVMGDTRYMVRVKDFIRSWKPQGE